MWSPNLKNFWQSIKIDRFLLATLLVGLLLRGLNPTFGSPSLYISNDEAIAHLSALNMIATKTPVSISNYTPLGAYVQIPFLAASFFAMKFFGLVRNVMDFELFILTHEGYFLFIPRLVSALFGTLSILVVYKITFILFKEKKVAIVAAFLTAVSFNLVHISHFGRPWSPALFFLTLAVYFALKKRGFLAFVLAGLSYGFHQVGILGLPLVLWLLSIRIDRKNLFTLIIFCLTIVFFSSLTLRVGLIESIRNDQSFLKSGKFVADLITGSPNLGDSAIRSVKGNLLMYFVKNFLVTDGVIFLFGIFGLLKSFKKPRHRKLILYIVAYFLFASFFFHPLLRYLLPIILLLISFSAFGLVSIFKKKNILIIFVLALASINSLWWNSLFLKKPTFILAADWIQQNIAPAIPIAYSGGRYQTFVPDQEAINHVRVVNSKFYEKLSSFSPSEDLANVRNIVYVSNFPGQTKLDKLKNLTDNYMVEYVVDYYIDPADRFYNLNPRKFDVVAAFNPVRGNKTVGIAEALFDATWNFPTNDPRKKVSMYSLSNAGPYVDILKLR